MTEGRAVLAAIGRLLLTRDGFHSSVSMLRPDSGVTAMSTIWVGCIVEAK